MDRRHARVAAAAFVCLALLGAAVAVSPRHTAATTDPVIAAAGDIACDPGNSNFNAGNGNGNACRQLATSNLVFGTGVAAVLTLGDAQDYCGSDTAYTASYNLSWGRLKPITHPVPGNHDYITAPGSVAATDCTTDNAGAAGYFGYFGAAAGTRGQGWYSYDVGAWHIIALNSNCSDAGGCAQTTPQGKWLAADLAAHQGRCILAYWHIPLFSSGGRAARNSYTFWQQLYAAHADVILHGHDHIYERFAPQTPSGTADPVNGIREFISGTGGQGHTTIPTLAANSEVRNNTTFGVLKLTLHQASYDWQFVPAVGTFTDSGSAQCHAATAAATAGPSVSATPTAAGSATATAAPTASSTATAVATASALPTSAPTPAATASAAASPSVSPSPPPSTLTVNADAYVNSTYPSSNYGSSVSLRVDGSPTLRSYLRWNLGSLTTPVTRATLRLYANSSLSAGVKVSTSASTWGESTITFANAPAPGAAVASSGAVTAGSWVSVDVTSLLNGNLGGTLGIVLTTTSSTQLNLASREGANPPQLLLQR